MTSKTAAYIVLVILAISAIGYGKWLAANPDPGQAVSGKTWSGLVNSVDRDIPVAVRRQWEAQLQLALASYAQKADWGTLQNIAALEYSLGNYAAAREAIERLLAENKINYGAWMISGDILAAMEDWKGADAAYLKVVELGGLDQLLVEKVEQLWRNHFPEKNPKIKGLLEAAIAYDGQKSFYMVKLAQWYAEQGDYANAVSHMRVAATLEPNTQAIKDDLAAYEAKEREAKR
jgi:tetratricopeptide (TPR) repeat protein